ncbi:MAG TPA: glycosyltransferase [Terracidiphilus sp.]|nr:glycosyltransferase [Terracidiphilus sp.]
MSSKVAVVSLRCNPAFLQHLIAYAKLIRELGCEPVFLLDPDYRKFPELAAVADIWYRKQDHALGTLTHVIFLNASIGNRKLARSIKRVGAKIFYVYHEPWQMSREYIQSEGWRATFKAAVAYRATVPVLRLSDGVILESECGLRAYRKGDVRFNDRCVYIPQIYDDEAPSNLLDMVKKKRFFGYVGNLCRAHGFDQFVNFIRWSFQRGADMHFLIASRLALPDEIFSDPVIRNNQHKLTVRCGRPLSNAEMNQCYADCFCIWNLYRRSTQSGVLPKAFMFGTPVIASRIGSFPEYVREGRNGAFAGGENSEQIWKAAQDFQLRAGSYAEGCRSTFLKTFYYRPQLEAFGQILNGVPQDTLAQAS